VSICGPRLPRIQPGWKLPTGLQEGIAWPFRRIVEMLRCRLVNGGHVPKPRTSSARDARKQVLGIRVTPDLRKKVKMEAARRGVTLAGLFDEMWRAYSHRSHEKA
jgi:hypothetical protein